MLVQFARRDQRHIAEAARIIIADDGAVAHGEDEVVVLAVLPRLLDEFAENFAMALAGSIVDDEASAHAEMHGEHFAPVQPDHEIFRAPVQPLDAAALQPLGEILRKRKAQIRAALLHLGEARAFHHRSKAPPHGFDFGEFGHGVRCQQLAADHSGRGGRAKCKLGEAGRNPACFGLALQPSHASQPLPPWRQPSSSLLHCSIMSRFGCIGGLWHAACYSLPVERNCPAAIARPIEET